MPLTPTVLAELVREVPEEMRESPASKPETEVQALTLPTRMNSLCVASTGLDPWGPGRSGPVSSPTGSLTPSRDQGPAPKQTLTEMMRVIGRPSGTKTINHQRWLLGGGPLRRGDMKAEAGKTGWSHGAGPAEGHPGQRSPRGQRRHSWEELNSELCAWRG